MKKSDLKTGMQVELRDGSRCIVVLGTTKGDVLRDLNDATWIDIDSLNESLVSMDEHDLDVMSVFSSHSPFKYVTKMDDSECVWRRDEVEKIDIEEGKIYVSEEGSYRMLYRVKKVVDSGRVVRVDCHSLWSNAGFSINFNNAVASDKYRTCRPATPKEAAKLVKKEIKNGYYWNGTELIKIK